MKVKEAIVLFEKQLKAAQAVLDSGFGTHPGEHDFLYRRRKEMAEIALAALRPAAADQPLTLEQLREMDGKPVWVDFTGSSFERPAGWFILKNVENGEAYLVGKTSVYKALEYYGKVWRAYAYTTARIEQEAGTNADIIRAMSDQELAAFLGGVCYGRDEPWERAFKMCCCDPCPTVEATDEYGIRCHLHECDFADGVCPHGDSVLWWLVRPQQGE